MLFPNVPTKTLGGQVFWNTLDRRNGWKLQQNMFTQHFRILDPDSVRQAWGQDEGEMWRTFRMFAGSRNE